MTTLKTVWTILAALLAATALGASPDQRQSAYSTMSRQYQVMQDDLSIHPATFWLKEGETLWAETERSGARACLACHGDAKVSMRGVAATFPKAIEGRLMTLEGQINQCRVRHQGLAALGYETQPLLSLTTLVAAQSRGLPIRIDSDKAIMPLIERGRALYTQRMGQLNLSCAQCHDDRAGQTLGGVAIPQGHPTGYPIYRIEWQTLGSLQRRVRNCMAGVRAERYEFGSAELGLLEAYLMHRASGMTMESPGVRP